MHGEREPGFPPHPQGTAGLGSTLACLCGFLLLGCLAAVLGPVLPPLRERFGLDAGEASVLVSAHFAGAVLGVAAQGLLAGRGSRFRLGAPLVVLGVGALGIALASTWPQAVAAALVLGLGFGALDLGLNILVARGYGAHGPAMLNLLGAAFGIGAVAAPLLCSLDAGSHREPFLYLAAGTGLTLLVLVGGDVGGAVLRGLYLDRGGQAAEALMALSDRELGDLGIARSEIHDLVRAGRAARDRSRRTPGSAGLDAGAPKPQVTRVLVGFAALLSIYVGVEAGVATWEATHLVDALGWSAEGAAWQTAQFWLAFAAGRLVGAPLALRLAPGDLVTSALALSAACLGVAATVPAAAPSAYALTAFFLGPVFPTAFAWLPKATPVGEGAVAAVFAASLFGPVVVSPLARVSADLIGAGAIPAVLLLVAAGAAVLARSLQRGARRAVADRRRRVTDGPAP